MVSKYQVIFLFSLFHNINAWNPNNYPFLPASADSSNIRKLIIDAQGTDQKILDIGCGLGYSTSETPGSVGIDINKINIKKASKIFPNKTFKRSFINIKNDEYDIVTSMFFFHELPQPLRKKILNRAINMAKKRVIIVDIDPFYDATLSMSKNKPFLNDYFQNIRDDLQHFNESTIVKGLLTMWVYDKNIEDDIIKTEYDIENDKKTDIINKNNEVLQINEYLRNQNIPNFISKNGFLVN